MTNHAKGLKASIPIKITALVYMCCAYTSGHTQPTSNESLKIASALCNARDQTPPELQSYSRQQKDIVARESKIGVETTYSKDEHSLKIEFIEPAGRPPRMAFTSLESTKADTEKQPTLRLVLDAHCSLAQAQRIVYENTIALYTEHLNDTLTPIAGSQQWLNPSLPDETGRRDGLKVAMIDSGVNYTLPSIAAALAINESGDLLGYDFWDNDNTPFDAHPTRSPFFIQRHGTRTASILLKEAPDIALVPYRYPRPDMSRMQQLIDHAASHNIKIIGMPLGSNNADDWQAFSRAAGSQPDMLFVVSAGNNGRNIDDRPVYPAALEHPNIIVVTSADDFARPAERTNYGQRSVDYMLPAEGIETTDFDGTRTRVSGSSYAVSRMTALAARLLDKQPGLSVQQLKDSIAALSAPATDFVAIGYIGDPLADTDTLQLKIDNTFTELTSTHEQTVQLNLVALDTDWTTNTIEQALNEVASVYASCNIGISADKLLRIMTTREELSHLATGTALSLHRFLQPNLQPDIPTVYFSNDTRMLEPFDAEAFGLANTQRRPWLKNTVWVTKVTRDKGLALAHELYHVLANDGSHNTLTNNLMQDTTNSNHTELTNDQCKAAITTAQVNKLLSVN